MAIYMKLDKIKGGVTTDDFKETIELTSFSTGSRRNISQPIGSEQNRGKAVTEVEMVSVSKAWDGHSSSKLFQSIGKGDMDLTATISFTNADKQTYLECALEKVALASYSISGSGGPDMDVPHEEMTLSFTAIQWTPYTIGSDKKPKKGDMVKHDLPTGTVS